MKLRHLWSLLAVFALAAFGYANTHYDLITAEHPDPTPAPAVSPSASPSPTTSASATPSPTPTPTPTPPPTVAELQQVLANLRIPVGAVDGKFGNRTRQGVCIWRELTGREANRNVPSDAEIAAIMGTSRLDIPILLPIGLNINKVCQSAIWINDATGLNFEIFPVSTGRPGLESTNGTWSIGWRVDRWYESILYPDGWMYRPMFYHHGEAIHGSESDSMVAWYPASHGCIRMPQKAIDELWSAGFKNGSTVNIYGAWSYRIDDSAAGTFS